MLILSQFRDRSLQSDDFPEVLRRLRTVTLHLSEITGNAYTWYSQGSSLKEVFLYPAWSGDVASTAFISNLQHQFRKDSSHTFVALWNGVDNDDEGITIACHISAKELQPDTLEVEIPESAAFGSAEKVADLVSCIVKLFDPENVSVAPRGYVTHRVFEDRPGVGWMLYLPYQLTPKQLPEAGALTAVEPARGRRPGTIVVSEPDNVFSLENPEHIEHANRIEIWLVEIDVLPRFEDLFEFNR